MTDEIAKISVKDKIDEYLTKKEYLYKTDLCSLMTSFGSDKGKDYRHNYTTLYSKLFSPWKNDSLNLFELGVGTPYDDVPSSMGKEGKPGASLYGWAEYFPKAAIYGADIDRRILFQTDRIKTFFCDQRDRNSIQELFSNQDLAHINFDIMIDDGLHDFAANLNFLMNSIAKLKSDGIYIIEDLTSRTRRLFEKIILELQKMLSLKYIKILELPCERNTFDNTLLVIQK